MYFSCVKDHFLTIALIYYNKGAVIVYIFNKSVVLCMSHCKCNVFSY